MRDSVARVRQLLAEARTPKPTDSEEARARRAFDYFDFNSSPPPVLEQTPRARTLRDITRIATWYGWGGEVARALDAAQASSPADLTDEQLEALQARLQRLEHCAQEGLDCPDAPPAR